MSRLLIVTKPGLVTGFQLAGVDAFVAQTSNEAQKLIDTWLDAGEAGLLAIDEQLLAGFDDAFRQRLTAAEQLPHLALPGGNPGDIKAAGRRHIAALLRQALGFHITFRGEVA
jgi:vacuolar-type H+-ATPase subunit F/Vma7